MGNPRILYQNRATGATITSDVTPDSGYPLANLPDWRNWLRAHFSGANSYWIKINAGAAVTAQALGVSGHTIFSAGGANARYKLDASANDADWDAIIAYTDVDSDKTFIKCFTQASYRYWRITIDNDGGATFSLQLGNLFIGNYIEMPQPIETPHDPDRFKDYTNKTQSDTGQFLGVALDFSQRVIEANFRALSRSWYTATFLPAYASFRLYPFYWAWDYARNPADAYLVWLNQDELNAPIDKTYRSLNLKMVGEYET
jgi:hypothetical protein